MEEWKTKTFKDLEDELYDITEKFFYAKRVLQIQNSEYLAEEDFANEDSLEKYLLKVEKAYRNLSEAERNLINNEFFYQSYHQWWKPIYSKATFYRNKKMAMQKFLGAFYEA